MFASEKWKPLSCLSSLQLAKNKTVFSGQDGVWRSNLGIGFKGIVHPKKKLLSLFIHPHFIPNPNAIIFFLRNTKEVILKSLFHSLTT